MLKVIGWYQIFGGLWGLGIIAMGNVFNSLANLSSQALLLVTIGILLYSFSILCGFFLLSKKSFGVMCSQVNQLAQVLIVLMLNVGVYKYISGAYIAIGFDLTEEPVFKVLFGIVSEFGYVLDENYPNNGLYVNILAILIYWMLDRYSGDLRTLGDIIPDFDNNIDLS